MASATAANAGTSVQPAWDAGSGSAGILRKRPGDDLPAPASPKRLNEGVSDGLGANDIWLSKVGLHEPFYTGIDFVG